LIGDATLSKSDATLSIGDATLFISPPSLLKSDAPLFKRGGVFGRDTSPLSICASTLYAENRVFGQFSNLNQEAERAVLGAGACFPTRHPSTGIPSQAQSPTA